MGEKSIVLESLSREQAEKRQRLDQLTADLGEAADQLPDVERRKQRLELDLRELAQNIDRERSASTTKVDGISQSFIFN